MDLKASAWEARIPLEGLEYLHVLRPLQKKDWFLYLNRSYVQDLVTRDVNLRTRINPDQAKRDYERNLLLWRSHVIRLAGTGFKQEIDEVTDEIKDRLLARDPEQANAIAAKILDFRLDSITTSASSIIDLLSDDDKSPVQPDYTVSFSWMGEKFGITFRKPSEEARREYQAVILQNLEFGDEIQEQFPILGDVWRQACRYVESTCGYYIDDTEVKNWREYGQAAGKQVENPETERTLKQEYLDLIPVLHVTSGFQRVMQKFQRQLRD